MAELLIIARENKAMDELRSGLACRDFTCSRTSPANDVIERIAGQPPDLVLLETASLPEEAALGELVRRIKEVRGLPVIALIDGNNIDLNTSLQVDDFLVSPFDVREAVLRIRRLLGGSVAVKRDDAGSDELIVSGDLVIDIARCEVAIDGKAIALTFKEYELLKLLAANRGRVYTREALLNKIWGYDYYGGARTVDTHIRRLRSKTEDINNTFIETVRNIGYRFRKDD